MKTRIQNKPDIIKIAGLPINQDGHLLIVKPKNKGLWISLGGKLEKGETDEQCLRREIIEELNIDCTSTMKHFLNTPIEIAANTTDKTVVIRFYLLELDQEPQPDNIEIEDYRWISKKDFEEIIQNKSINIGSGLELYAIPKLISEGILK